MRSGPVAGFAELTYAAMRISLALLYLSFGVQKLFGAFGGRGAFRFSRLLA